MVDGMDWNVGRVLSELKKNGQLDNTIIIFIADNGVEGTDFLGGGRIGNRSLSDKADNTPENIGKDNSFSSIGPIWVQAANTPSYLYKDYSSEGGTRTTAFVTYSGFKCQKQVSNVFASVQDIYPTLLDAAGIPLPKDNFHGRKIQDIHGKSWIPYLNGKAETIYAPDYAFGTELFGSRSIRKGDWKILAERGNDSWKLFNIAKDPGETQDLSTSNSEKLKELIADWNEFAKKNNIIIPDVALF